MRTIESSCADIIISWNDYISNGERLFPSVLAEQIFLMMKAFDIAYYHKSIMEDIPTTRGIDCSVRVLQTEYKVKLSFRWVTKELRKYLKKVPESVVESVEQCAICREIKPFFIFKFCSNCKKERYCSKECQIKHWKAGHKLECKTA